MRSVFRLVVYSKDEERSKRTILHQNISAYSRFAPVGLPRSDGSTAECGPILEDSPTRPRHEGEGQEVIYHAEFKKNNH